MKTFVVGDIHGNYDAFIEALKKSPFKPDKDKMIILGDIVDGYSKTFEVVEKILTFKNTIFILGNHDVWFISYYLNHSIPWIWTTQGGQDTIFSYEKNNNGLVPVTHQEFFNNAILYYIERDMIFVHGGFNPMVNIHKQDKLILTWNRQLVYTAKKKAIYRNDGDKIDKSVLWKKVFVGHTTTEIFNAIWNMKNVNEPIKNNNLIMLDTGGGWKGKVTIMDVDTEEYWQGG